MSTEKIHSVKPEFKTAEQTEFSELFQKLEAAKWNRAEVARALHVAPSAVTMLLKGLRNPRAATLNAMRELAAQVAAGREHGEAVEKKLEGAERVNDQLDYLREKDPAGFRVATTTIEILHQRARENEAPDVVIEHEKKPKRTSSERLLRRAAEAKSAGEKIGKLSPASKGSSEPRSAAGGPPERTRSPYPASREDAKAPPSEHGEKGRK